VSLVALQRGTYKVKLPQDHRPNVEEKLEKIAIKSNISLKEVKLRINRTLCSYINLGKLPPETELWGDHDLYGKIYSSNLYGTNILFCVREDLKDIVLVGV